MILIDTIHKTSITDVKFCINLIIGKWTKNLKPIHRPSEKGSRIDNLLSHLGVVDVPSSGSAWMPIPESSIEFITIGSFDSIKTIGFLWSKCRNSIRCHGNHASNRNFGFRISWIWIWWVQWDFYRTESFARLRASPDNDVVIWNVVGNNDSLLRNGTLVGLDLTEETAKILWISDSIPAGPARTVKRNSKN